MSNAVSHEPAFCDVTILVPVFNEDASIGQVLDRLLGLDLQKQILVADDGSTDRTPGILQEFAAQGKIQVVRTNRNRGKGSAIRAALPLAGGRIVVIQDADLEYDPNEIPSLIDPILRGDADVVYGSRFLSHARSQTAAWHQLANSWLTWYSNRCTGLSLTDMETGYKAFRRELLESIPLEQDGFGFEPEITAKLARRKCRFMEVPISYQPRGWKDGKKIGAWDGLRAIYCVLRYAARD